MEDAALPDMEDLSIPQLISLLWSSSRREEFERAERILQSRQESLRAEVERSFSGELTLKEADKIDLEARCEGLERNLNEEKEKHASLAARFEESEREKSASREEVEKYRSACERLGTQKLALLLENQKEKEEVEKKTRGEIDYWKRKCAELEARVLRLEEENSSMRGWERETKKHQSGEDSRRQSRAQPLAKLEVGSRVLGGIIEISDGEDDIIVDADTSKCSKMMQIDKEEDDSSCGMDFFPTSTPKRKLTVRIITSDSDDDDDEDRIPLSKLRKLGDAGNCSPGYNDIQEDVTPSRRRLVPLRERDETKGLARGASPRDSARTPTETNERVSRNRTNARRWLDFSETEGAEEDDNVGLESEDESLGGFIVEDSNGSESKSSSNDASEEEEEQSDSDVNLSDVLAKIRREKDTKKWEFEADMLSAFAKNPELCMKAVCTLWRLQTSEEQSVKQTMVVNNQGFNKLDAGRGSRTAEFLTDGNPYGPVKKTLQEFQKYDPQGLEYCLQLATRYSKQLYMIYQNNEDPYLHPS